MRYKLYLSSVLILSLAFTGCLPCLGSLESPADFETAVNELLADLAVEENDVAAGICQEDGPLFLFYFTGPFTYRWDYFDVSTGVFISRTEGGGDVIPIGFSCPRFVACSDPIVTEVIGGTRYQVGDGTEVFPALGR